jgi:hypothetical protein
LQYADDTIIFMDHDIEQAKKYELAPLHFWTIIGSKIKLS